MKHFDIIKKPIITEKSNLLKETNNQISFEVDKNANRIEIKQAVEKIFKVHVQKVSTIQVKGKVKQKGKVVGKRRDRKKALVKLKPGERIDFFEGV